MNYKGVSGFATMHNDFPVERFMQQFPKDKPNVCTAILLGCFGWNPAVVDQFCTQFPKGLLEIHVSNGPSRRNGKLGKGAYGLGYSVKGFSEAWEKGGNTKLLKQLDTFALRWEKIYGPYIKSITLALSPELEDNMTDKAFVNFAKACKERFDPKFMVRSACKGGNALGPARYLERHGVVYGLGGGNFGNLDGVSVDFKDGETYFNQCSITTAKTYLARSNARATMLWSASQQGARNASGWSAGWPPHKLRKFYVTDEAIKGVRSLLKGAL